MSEPIIVTRLPEIIGAVRQTAPISAVRLPADLTAAIDAWALDHETSRSEAIRRLVEIALKAEAK
jgi:metal-responsive CopG/Arc/MetJ family transcriptional regulator